MLFTLLGVVAFIWTVWEFSPEAFAAYPVVDWLVRILSIVLVVVFLYPMRTHLMEWARGEKAPWLSALGMLGGGFGMAMVATFLLSKSLGVLGNWDFSASEEPMGADYRHRDHRRLCRLVLSV